MSAEPDTLYDVAGGMAFFERLVDAFYRRVERDDVLLPLYPDRSDLDGARTRLALFLAQYWGGPTTYLEVRGHPRLRMRHAPFPVGPEQRDHWLMCMAGAIDEVDPPPAVRDELWTYFVRAAEHLRNDTGLPISSADYPR